MPTVVAFEPLGQDTVAKLSDSPLDVEGLGQNAIVDVSPVQGGNVRQRGEALMQRLEAHEVVREGVSSALMLPPGSDPSPLYFHVTAEAADALPWEVLYAANRGFCTLDPRWPVARIARRRRNVPPRELAGPLRIVAVLSAAGRSGRAQFDALVAAVTSADGQAIPAELEVFTADEDVLDAPVPAGAPVTVTDLPADTNQLTQRLGAAEPHVLHVFCHGGIVGGAHTLAFAKPSDFDAGQTEGSLRLTLMQLVGPLLEANTWLVTLNACATAADDGTGSVLAHELASAGVPAVIGMRRLVDVLAADRFASALYPTLLAEVRKVVQAGAGTREIEWAELLVGPRTALANADPEHVEEWSDPVLYVQHDRFRVFRPGHGVGARSRLQGRLDELERFLAQLDPATTDPAVIDEVEQLAAEVRDELSAQDE